MPTVKPIAQMRRAPKNKIVLFAMLALPLAACGGTTVHSASSSQPVHAASPRQTTSTMSTAAAGGPQTTTTPNCPQVNRVLNSVFDGSYAGLLPAKTTQDLIDNFLGQTMDANGNPQNAMEPVMVSLGETRGGKGPRGMPPKLLQAEADLYVVVGLMANEQSGYWTQQNINTLQNSLMTIDEICATPSTPWAQQFEKGLQ